MRYRGSRRLRGANRSKLAVGAVAGLALLVVPFVLGPFRTLLVSTILLFGVFATAFNLLYGYTGLLSFGHAMFLATAAYGAAKVFRLVGPVLQGPFGGTSVLVTFFLAVLVGTALSTLLGVVIGYFSVKLEEIYFAMITLSFSMAIWAIFQKNISGQFGELVGLRNLLTSNGSDGLLIPYTAMGEVELFGLTFLLMDISNYTVYYLVVLLASVFSLYALWRIVRSPFGAVCRAVRENPQRARALGIDTTFHSWMTFVVSAAFSGLAGSLYAPLQGNVNPGLAIWTTSAEPVIMTVIGGPYSFFGPIVGAVVYKYIRHLINTVTILGINLNPHWQLVFGSILVAVVLFFDNGVAGGLERLWLWSTTARNRFRADGVAGVRSFLGETVAVWFAAVREGVLDRVRAVRERLAAVGKRLGLAG